MNMQTTDATSTPASEAGTAIIMICATPQLSPALSCKRAIMAAVAAATGLAGMAMIEVIVAIDIGRSGRTPF